MVAKHFQGSIARSPKLMTTKTAVYFDSSAGRSLHFRNVKRRNLPNGTSVPIDPGFGPDIRFMRILQRVAAMRIAPAFQNSDGSGLAELSRALNLLNFAAARSRSTKVGSVLKAGMPLKVAAAV